MRFFCACSLRIELPYSNLDIRNSETVGDLVEGFVADFEEGKHVVAREDAVHYARRAALLVARQQLQGAPHALLPAVPRPTALRRMLRVQKSITRFIYLLPGESL